MNKNEMIHIAVAINDAYFEPLYVSLFSLFCNTNNKCSIYVLYENLNIYYIHKLHKLSSQFKQNICFRKVNIELNRQLTYIENWSHEIVYKMFLAQIFSNLDKIIWVDADTCFLGDVKSIWDIDVRNYAIAAVEDSVSKYMPQRGLNWNKPYFNVGMLVLNLKNIRDWELTYSINQVITEIPSEKLWLPEQDIMNMAFRGMVKLVDAKYNAQNAFYWKYAYRYNGVNQAELFNSTPIMVHFTGGSKPWHKISFHPYTSKWRDYASKCGICHNYKLNLFDKIKAFISKHNLSFKSYKPFPTYKDVMVSRREIKDLQN